MCGRTGENDLGPRYHEVIGVENLRKGEDASTSAIGQIADQEESITVRNSKTHLKR